MTGQSRRLFTAFGLASVLSLGAGVSGAPPAASGGSCDALRALPLAGGAITLAESVPAGGFTPPGVQGGRGGAAPRRTPAFCRVAATLRPSSDSDVKIEVWMPTADWNGKYQAVGNGGWAGSLSYDAMITALGRGYAVSSTDTGHEGGSAAFALGHPEQVVDFGYRAVHEMTVAAKAIIARYYDAAPKRSYWTGCSGGGRQAMKEAQRFPGDFDGIIAGSPALDHIGRAAQAVRVAQRTEADEASRLPAAKAQLLHRAVLEACDALDGVRDGVLEDPTRCRFDPGVLQCKGADDGACLTAAQVATARLVYSAAVGPKSGRKIAGLARGSELGWSEAGWSAFAQRAGLEHFRFIVFQNPEWSLQSFTLADIDRADEVDKGTINALDPNLKPFFDRGGKLIHYHGWSDPQISPENSTSYYERVAAVMGGVRRTQQSYRLFMVPGMAHCGGGEGPNTFDMLAALEQWVERGRAPARIVASRVREGRVERTRPLCPYPQVAAYMGTGSTDDEASFVCRERS